MSQISPPIRILLVAVIGVIAVYMLFLRPKAEETTPVAAAPAATTPVPAKDPNATTSSKPGSAVNQAVRGADSASARADAAAGGAVAETEGGTAPATAAPATGATATTPATGVPVTGVTAAPAPVTKETLASLPKDIRRAVRKQKVLVVLFYNNRSADDRAVRRALSKVSSYGGQVFVDAHWIKSVSRYQAIARGVDVEQSPTIVVADRNLKAETLVGYVDDKTIDQAVVDALRASGGSLIKNPYFNKLDRLCMSTEQQVNALPQPTSTAGLPAFLTGARGVSLNAQKKVTAIKPPAKYKKFHNQFVIYGAATTSLVTWAAGHSKAHPAAAIRTLTKQGKALDKKFVAKNGAHGLGASCF